MTAPASIADTLDAAAPVAPVNTYYDTARKEYLWPRPDGSGWLTQTETQIKRHLQAAGYDRQVRKGENVSPLDKAIIELQLNCAVAYSGPLAGYKAGVYFMQGKLILVTASPVLVTPAPGEWPTIRHLRESLLADPDHDQAGMLDAWLKVMLHALYDGPPRAGQAFALCGPKNCGKSLLQNLLTIIIGGRAAKPYQFALGESGFNSDLFHAEHLMIEDEAPSTDMRARRTLGSFIKQVAANTVHRLHAKNANALTLEPGWRLTISCNDEPEHLLTLPPLDESLLDKIIMLRCSRPAEPFNDGTPGGRKRYWDRLAAEVPAYVHHLLGWTIPDALTCPRFGVSAFQHPELVEALLELSSERQLLSLVDVAGIIPGGDHNIGKITIHGADQGQPWEGTAEDLERALRADETTRREAERLFTWRNAAGVFLGRLAQTDPSRVRRLPRGHGENRRWAVYSAGSLVNP